MHPQRPACRLGILAAIGGIVIACTAASTPPPTATPSPTPAAAPTATSSPALAAAPTATPSPTAPQGALPKPELSSLKIGIAAGGDLGSMAAIQASTARIMDKYGITSTVSTFESIAKTVEALQAGQIEVGVTDSGSALSSQLTDVQLVTVGISAATLPYDLVCQGTIKTAADVKGKRVGASVPGGTLHAAALIALKSLGLGATDVVINQFDPQAFRIAVLRGGQIDCAILDKVLGNQIQAQGFSIVTSTWKPPAQTFGRSAIVVTKAFLAKNPNTVLVALAGAVEGQNLIWTDATGTAERWAQWAQTDVATATPLVADFQTVGNRSMMWKDEAFINAKEVIAAVNPGIGNVDITKAFDRSLLQKLVDLGFFAKIGNPATTP